MLGIHVMSSTPVQPPRNFAALRTHAVDRVSSVLIALVVMVGLAVVVMGAIYLSRLDLASPDPIMLEPEDEQAAGRGDHAAGFARDFAPPGQEEVEELTEPTLEQSLEAVTDAVTSIAASLNTVESAATEASHGSGLGDSRPPGPLGEGPNIISRAERWELKFTARNLRGYAAQLDAFKIELGAVGGNVAHVDYVSQLSSSAPQHRRGDGAAEKRLYFLWRQDGPLQQYDAQLMRAAGVDTTGRQIIKFLTPELEDQLARLELQYAFQQHNRRVAAKEFAKTVFECQPSQSAAGYEWVVIEQRLRVTGGK